MTLPYISNIFKQKKHPKIALGNGPVGKPLEAPREGLKRPVREPLMALKGGPLRAQRVAPREVHWSPKGDQRETH